VAQSSTRVSTLMRNIASSQWLRNPELEVVEISKDVTGGSRFVLDAQEASVAGDADEGAPARHAMRAAAAGSPR
jgi:Tfp pilus assembly protein PilN